MFYKSFSIFGPLQLELAALVQIVLIVLAAYKFNITLSIRNRNLRYLSLVALCAPCAYWGRQIGSDALGYSLMLYALSYLGKNHLMFFTMALLASITRFQYIALFAGFLAYKRTAWIPAVMAIGLSWVIWTSWHGMFGMYGKVYKTLEYVACSVEHKSEHVSHAEYFNLVWGAHDSPEGTHSACVSNELLNGPAVKGIWQHRSTFFALISSKLRDACRFHQLALFVVMMLVPIRRIRHVALVSMCMYLTVLLTSSMKYMQYTFMCETVMIAVVIRFYDAVRLKLRRA
jgi:hypothetical protein